LRQPVHVDDLAEAAFAALQAPMARDAFDLPGGETLPYRDMVRRVLATLQPPPRLHEVPAPLFATAVGLARASGRLGGFGDAALARLRQDLVFDATPAREALGYAPRPFRPTTAAFSED
jgi:nucleoside-diphosphate-sugar epimerase